jgi:hypothetical protein
MLFLSQEVVRCEIWTGGFHIRHSYRQRSPRKEMQSIIHPNEWVQYISQLQYVVQSHKNQDRARIFTIPNQS